MNPKDSSTLIHLIKFGSMLICDVVRNNNCVLGSGD